VLHSLAVNVRSYNLPEVVVAESPAEVCPEQAGSLQRDEPAVLDKQGVLRGRNLVGPDNVTSIIDPKCARGGSTWKLERGKRKLRVGSALDHNQ